MRLGPGPVFVYEWLTTARRWQLYAMRTLFVGAILVVLAVTWNQIHRYRALPERVSLEELARYGESIYFAIVLVELTLVLLAAPAATAGAVCLDKARGTLDHVLTTDLSNAEIVLGKLGVRLIPVLGLIACTLPVVALTSLLGGIDPLALAGSFLVSIGCALVACSLAMTLSVWARKSHEVVIMTYMLLLIWLCFPGLAAIAMYFLGLNGPAAAPIWEVIAWTNPYYLLFAPYTNPTSVDLWTFLIFLGACLATSGGLVGLATVRIRRVAMRQAGRPVADRRRWLPRLRRPSWLPGLPGPSLDLNPVAWREWHRMRPSWMMRIAWGLYAAVGVLWLVLSLRQALSTNMLAEEIAMMSAFQVALGLLLLSVSAATSLAEERVRGSLDILLSTPMSTRSILAGKWWGTFRQVGPVLFWPALLSAGLLLHAGTWSHYLLLIGVILGYGAVITSLGLALATWMSRLGRAIALCVTAYVVFSIGWPILIALTWKESSGPGLLMGCPAVGTFIATALVGPIPHLGPRERSQEYPAALAIWMMLDVALAAALFALTCSTFDGRLGRMPETSDRPPPGKPKGTSPAFDELLDPVPSPPKDRPDEEQGPAPHHPP
jgi:ABC-type transport system involved in multi-copper enzyme maturation permease subunit